MGLTIYDSFDLSHKEHDLEDRCDQLVAHCRCVTLGLLSAQEGFLFAQVKQLVIDLLGPVIDKKGYSGLA